MNQVGQVERATQDRIVELFSENLGYQYLGNLKATPNNSNIVDDLLRANLEARGYEESVISKAIAELERIANNQADSLYDVNKAVYKLLRYGVSVKPDVTQNYVTVKLIDWDDVEANDFAVAEEVSVTGDYGKRPDVVLYVNGIALGVIELKRSKVSVSEGIRQNLDNQKPMFIKHFFTTMQLVMAGNDTQGLRYGTIETPERYYLTWKEEGSEQPANSLDDHLTQICRKDRLLELIHDFIIFDAGTKKIARHNQYFAVKAAQERIQQGEGGIIWNTQGSGKSLIMVWLTKWIREHYPNARVLIITDRTELDDQIESIYRGVDENIIRTSSSQDLIDRLQDTTSLLMCSLIQKFPGKDEGNIDKYLHEIENSVPADFQAYGDFFVFVDECHRTQSGVLHAGMKQLLPDALFIGFTGTPLLKVDKERRTSIETFGPYIHTYKYDEAVADGVILDLRYEARDIDQHLESPEEVDQWFEAKTANLTNTAAAQLKERWGTMQSLYSSEPRLQRIVQDIYFDMNIKERLATGRGNALLVAGSIYEACRLYELFQDRGFAKCAIVTSYDPRVSNIKGESTGEGETEELQKYEIYQEMLGGKSVEAFENEVKKKFVEEPGQMKLLIVVDKLLTGFDAPSATYLYIDKTMRDHGLFQAICRVNRLDSEDKKYGHIIDYKDLFRYLERSIQDYTSGAFEGFDKEDVEGLLTDRLEKGVQRLQETREWIKALCEAVEAPQDTQAFIRYFCGEDPSDPEFLKRREKLYKYAGAYLRAFSDIAPDLFSAGYTRDEIAEMRDEVNYYDDVRTEIRLASGDAIDLKLYEPAMRFLLDTYIQADKSRKVSAFDNMTLVELIVERGIDMVHELPDSIKNDEQAVAETIENNVRRVIIDERNTNPQYYSRMSELLEALIEQRRAAAIEYEQYLARIVELTKMVVNPSAGADYPELIDTPYKQALYERLESEEEAIAVAEAVDSTKKHGWRGDPIKEREIKYAIYQVVSDEELTEELFTLLSNQREY